MTPTSSALRVAPGLYELSLEGRFAHPHWVAFLFSGLAALKVAVVSGRAAIDANHEWTARFHLDFKASTASPDALDYVALAQRKPAAFDSTVPRLSKFEIARRDELLAVRLEGPDQIGFLGRLLNRIALLALFPTEIEINTVGGRIRDRIVFQGIAGTVPNAAVQESLQGMLHGLIAVG